MPANGALMVMRSRSSRARRSAASATLRAVSASALVTRETVPLVELLVALDRVGRLRPLRFGGLDGDRLRLGVQFDERLAASTFAPPSNSTSEMTPATRVVSVTCWRARAGADGGHALVHALDLDVGDGHCRSRGGTAPRPAGTALRNGHGAVEAEAAVGEP